MNDSVHQMSLLVGKVIGEIAGLKDSIEHLNRTWGEREKAATEGRRILHDKFEGVQHDVMRMEATVENVSRDVSAIKPSIEQFKTDRDEDAGAQRLGKRIWIGFIGLAGLAGGGFAELFHSLRGH